MNNDKQDVVELLGGLGVGHNEAVTYAGLLELGGVSIRKIAEFTGINRGTTYEALKKLTNLGLVAVKRKGNREQYTAESPEKIFDIIREKRRDLMEIDIAAKELVPDLLARQPSHTGQPLVRYYEGDDGVVTILKDVLQTCRNLAKPEYCAYSSSYIRKYLYRKFPQFTQRRVDEGVYVRVIAEEQAELAEHAERKWFKNPNHTQLSSYTIIYGNKMALISVTADNTPYGVVIEDAGAASMQRLLFDQLWQYLD